jgi:hypothetical protein
MRVAARLLGIYLLYSQARIAFELTVGSPFGAGTTLLPLVIVEIGDKGDPGSSFLAPRAAHPLVLATLLNIGNIIKPPRG